MHSSDRSINFTLWKDGSSFLFADKDFDTSSVANITGKIYNKKKKEFKGRRAYCTQQMMQSDVIDVFITQLIFITNLPRMAIGTTVRAESK